MFHTSRWVIPLALHLLITIPAVTEAQTSVGGAYGLFDRTIGDSEFRYIGPGLGGHGPALSAFVLKTVTPAAAFGVELTVPGTINGMQGVSVGPDQQYVLSTHRDVFITSVVRFQAPYASHMKVAAMGGFGFAVRRSTRAGILRRIDGSQSPLAAYTLTSVDPAIVGGPNLVFAASKSIEIVAVARVHYVLGGDQVDSRPPQFGVSDLVMSFGVGAQFTF